MTLASDLRTLGQLVASPLRPRGGTHRERLDAFYAGQADGYDDFRRRLLQGRQALVDAMVARLPASGGVWLEIGAGTGANLAFLGERLPRFDRVILVDLCQPLLDVARRRVADSGWTNVELVAADATTFRPDVPVDAVLFSYALTMIPDWFAAIDAAVEALRPGGLLGSVDFYVSRKHDGPHRWLTRAFWRSWFAMDDVFLDGNHLPYLHRRTRPVETGEHRARLPYMPIVRAPYYRYIGRK